MTTTSTVIAALKPLQQQALFGPAVHLALAGVRDLQIDQNVSFGSDGFATRASYATGRGQGLLAEVTELNGCGHILPPDEFLTLPSCANAYSLLTLDTPHRQVPLTPSVIDLHAWLVARITDFMETLAVPWLWTSTGAAGGAYCEWRDSLYPATPLGDAFSWQASLEEVG